MSSDAFAATWTEANRTAHEQIVATLRGDPDALGQISDSGQLVIDITPIIEQVKAKLVDAGFELAGRIPTINVTFPVASSADLVRLQNAYRAIDVLGQVLPWISLHPARGGASSWPSGGRAPSSSRDCRSRGRWLSWRLALVIGRSFYANALPPTVQRPDVAVTLYDQFVSLLRIELRVGLVLGLVVAIIAFLAGGTPAARSVRETSSKGTAWVRGLGDRHGVGTGAFGVWLYDQRALIRVVVIGLAVLVLVLADGLTGRVVLAVAIVALLVLGVVTLLARPSARGAGHGACRADRRAGRRRAPPRRQSAARRDRGSTPSGHPRSELVSASLSRHDRRGSSSWSISGTASEDSPCR